MAESQTGSLEASLDQSPREMWSAPTAAIFSIDITEATPHGPGGPSDGHGFGINCAS